MYIADLHCCMAESNYHCKAIIFQLKIRCSIKTCNFDVSVKLVS